MRAIRRWRRKTTSSPRIRLGKHFSRWRSSHAMARRHAGPSRLKEGARYGRIEKCFDSSRGRRFSPRPLQCLRARVVEGGSRSRGSNRVPVMVGASEGEREFFGVRQLAVVVNSLREELDVPIFLNADHTHSLAKAVEAARRASTKSSSTFLRSRSNRMSSARRRRLRQSRRLILRFLWRGR